ncbi:MAG: DUF1259 domain-containing protein [Gemmatimonadales bacterium]
MPADVRRRFSIHQEVLVRASIAVRAAALAVCFWSAARPAIAQTPGSGHPSQRGAQGDWRAVDQAMGRSGTMQPGGVYKYSFPRADLRVTIGEVAVKPALALGSWVAFKRMGGASGGTTAMGDLVLLESEVTPVLTKLQAMGVEQTALHNHLQRESPRVMYLHIQAQGDPTKIAEAVRAALALTKTPPAPPAAAAGAFGLDTAQLASALGRAGKVNGGVYQSSVPRAGPVRMAGMEIPPAMGLATALNFQPTGGGKAAITGDFVLTADEVKPVIKTLRDGGIAVTALHSHMLGEDPRLFFMHFWANDDAMRLARTLRAALGQMKVPTEGA